jgi:hypothetical protein
MRDVVGSLQTVGADAGPFRICVDVDGRGAGSNPFPDRNHDIPIRGETGVSCFASLKTVSRQRDTVHRPRVDLRSRDNRRADCFGVERGWRPVRGVSGK